MERGSILLSVLCRAPDISCQQSMCLGLGQVGLLKLFFSFPTRVFGSQNLTTVKLKGVGESFKKYPDYESKGIKAHFNLDESGVLSLDRVRAKEEPLSG